MIRSKPSEIAKIPINNINSNHYLLFLKRVIYLGIISMITAVVDKFSIVYIERNKGHKIDLREQKS